MKRGLLVWRTLAVVLAAALIAVLVGSLGERGDYVARISVSGVIAQNLERDRILRDIASDSRAKALIVRINSPGGTVVGGESLYHDLRKVAKIKPVVAVIDTLGTSAAYMTALGADRIFARQGTITGSIGVILQATEFSGLLKKLGVTTEAVKSGPLKAVPSPFEPLSQAGREATQAVVMDIFDMFVDLVAERRGLAREDALRLADGRVYTGRQALAAKLVDALGGESDARSWLSSERDIGENLPIRDLKPDISFSPWRAAISVLTQKTVFSETLTLDGLVSLWHPELQ
jgi:protease-4